MYHLIGMTTMKNRRFEYKIETWIPKLEIVETGHLNKLGDDGWELVALLPSPVYRAYYKREIIEDEQETQEPKTNLGSD